MGWGEDDWGGWDGVTSSRVCGKKRWGKVRGMHGGERWRGMRCMSAERGGTGVETNSMVLRGVGKSEKDWGGIGKHGKVC